VPKSSPLASAKKRTRQTLTKNTKKRSTASSPVKRQRRQPVSASKSQRKRMAAWASPRAIVALFFVAACIGTGALFFEHAATAAATTGPVVSAIGNNCLDTFWGQIRTTARLEPCFNNAPQQWTFPGDGTIRNNNLCLDVQYSGTTPGTTVWLYTCNGTAAQKWVETTAGQIFNQQSNMCLDDSRFSAAAGNPIWMWPCTGANNQKWTVPKGVVLSAPIPVSGPSGQPAPVGNLPGWQQLFVDDFKTTIPQGAFSSCNNGVNSTQPYCNGLKPYGSYFKNWWAYPTGWPDTAKSGADGNTGAPFGGVYHPEDTVSVNNGAMHIHMYRPNTGGDNHVATVLPLACSNHQYGRYVERFKVVHADPGFKSAHLFYQGGYEIDYPENDYNVPISAYTHPGGANFSTSASWTTWHTTAIEWTAGSVKFYIDGRLIGTTTRSIPHIKMGWILQNESSILGPYAKPGASAQLDIDWVACYSPV
jgi:hypothetical protein